MTKEVQKKTTNTIENNLNKKLSVQFSLDGFSFCISDVKENILAFSVQKFDKKAVNPEELLLKIETIFKRTSDLQQDFSEVTAIHQNNLSTIVPNNFFDKTKLKEYLDFTVKTFDTDFISTDDLTVITAKNVYIPYVNINNFLFQNFGTFEYKHHTSVLIEKLLPKTSEKNMFVHVTDTNFDIIIAENKQLLFSNSFSFETKEDFIYYILFTAEQLQLDTDTFQLIFLDDIEEASEIYKITYQYIRNISFYKNDNSFYKTADFSEHANFILLG